MLKSKQSSASALLADAVRNGSSEYFQTISRIILDTAVTDCAGKKISFDEALQQALATILSLAKNSGKIMLIGNGGSASIASHIAVDFWTVAGISATAFNDPVQLTALSNDYGYEHVFAKAIEKFASPGDLLIALSCSGRSANVLQGAKIARQKQCAVITFSGFAKEAPLLTLGDLNFFTDCKSYGHVQIAHLAIIHYLSDMVCVCHEK